MLVDLKIPAPTRMPPRLMHGATAAFVFVLILVTVFLIHENSYGLSESFANALPESITKHTSKCSSEKQHQIPLTPTGEPWSFNYTRDGHKFSLTDDQCEIAFPRLFAEIDRSVEVTKQFKRRVTLGDMDNNMKGPGALRAMIYDGRLYVIDSIEADSDLFGKRALAILHSLNRAIISAEDPKSIPNVEFTMTVHDTTWIHYDKQSDRTVWSFTRKVADKYVWVMPEFGRWAWRQAHIGPPEDIRIRMEESEHEIAERGKKDGLDLFAAKIQKLMWRGNVDTAHELRTALLNASEGKSWSDVKPTFLDSLNNNIPMDQHCRWAYLAYTEGHSYSGRLKYLQNCYSVIIAHDLEWFIPWHALLIDQGPEQNYVRVRRDFEDLDAVMTHLLDHPDEARMIANNSISMFKERYLAPAAEACYWRRFIHSWREVSFEPEFYWWNEERKTREWRGLPFEIFALTGRVAW